MPRLRSSVQRVGAILVGLLASSATAVGGPEHPFNGRLLVVASDGDMQASAYKATALARRPPTF